MKYIEYASFRGCDITVVLKFEITPVPFYLTDLDDGSQKKPSKSLLTKKLIEKLSVDPCANIPLIFHSDSIIIFWLMQRKSR